MKEKTARELYEALEHACALLSAATKTKGSPDYVMKMGAKLIPGAPQRLIKATERGGAIGFLLAIPEPNEEEKAQLRTTLGELPFLFRKALVQAGKEAGKNLPYRRGKPTPEKLRTAQQKKEACDDVDRLLPLAKNLEDACKQVGKKYDASSRTIRRLWNPHHKAMKSAKLLSGS
jgi:hypothetical protein